MRERFCEGTRALPAAAGTVCGRWGAGSVNDMIIRESCPRGRPRSFTPMSGMRASASTHAETNAERVREHERPSDQSDPAGFPGPVIRMVRAVALRMIGNASSPRSKPARALVCACACVQLLCEHTRACVARPLTRKRIAKLESRRRTRRIAARLRGERPSSPRGRCACDTPRSTRHTLLRSTRASARSPLHPLVRVCTR